MISGFYIFAFISGLSGAWIITRCGKSLQLMDNANHRSSHMGEIPKGGGVGILLTFLVVGRILDVSGSFLIGTTVISILSFIDDKKGLSVNLRLFFHMVCSVMIILTVFHSENLSYYFLFPFFVIFIVGTTNIYNFMDGINGIAGITAVVAFSFLGFYLFLETGYDKEMILCFCMSASCIGFLPFNVPKAKVFLGDVGSILIGFVFSSVIIKVTGSIEQFLCLSGFLYLFYFDEVFTMYWRIRGGDSLTTPHRKHIYQLLANEMNVSHWKISLSYGFFQLIICLFVLLVEQKGLIAILILYVLLTLILIPVGLFIRKKAV